MYFVALKQRGESGVVIGYYGIILLVLALFRSNLWPLNDLLDPVRVYSIVDHTCFGATDLQSALSFTATKQVSVGRTISQKHTLAPTHNYAANLLSGL